MAGLYIHIPFCKKKCPYCDFVSYENKSDLIEEYLEALKMEIVKYKKLYDPDFKTVYIGGGTPNFLSEKQLQKLFSHLYSVIDRKKLNEITIEVNPGMINSEKASIIAENVNRVSIGMQSFNDDTLKILGRVHQCKENYLTFEILRRVKINNINIDLMYGVCEQELADVLDDIDKAIKLNPEHISFYLFTIKRKKFKGKKLPEDNIVADMYLNGIEKLKENKYIHYEISNFALKNKFCIHNLNYWNLNEYIGIGAAASSFFNNERFYNIAEPADYIKKIKENKTAVVYKEKIDENMRLKEYIMLKLRTKDGIDEEEFYKNFKFDFFLRYSNIINKYTLNSFMKRKARKIFLTEKGFLISNEIIKDFF